MINKEMKSGWFHLMQMIDESPDAVQRGMPLLLVCLVGHGRTFSFRRQV